MASALSLVTPLLLQTAPSAGQAPFLTESLPAQAVESPATRVMIRWAGGANSRPVPYENVKGLIVFRARVAGRDVWTMLDSGSERSLLSERFAREAGLSFNSVRAHIKAPTGVLTNAVRVAQAVHVTVPGAMDAELPELGVIDLKVVSDAMGREIDFVLGADFLSVSAILVRPELRQFRMGPSGSVGLPIEAAVPLLNDALVIQALVGDSPVVVSIDLGSNTTLALKPEAWRRVAPQGAGPSGLTASTNVDGQRRLHPTVLLPSLTVGKHHLKDVVTTIRPWAATEADGVIGMGLLGRYMLALDMKKGLLWIAPPRPTSAPAAEPPAAAVKK
jgi:hypothetical protein